MADRIELPPPDELGGMPLALALGPRRSHREFSAERLDWAQIGQLRWAAQDLARVLRLEPGEVPLYLLPVGWPRASR